MMLGVVLHVSNIYGLAGAWIISDPKRAVEFDLLGSAVHVFRMPAFFWIAGYFCGLTYQRSSTSGLLKKRLPRLAIPLLVAWLTLNVIQECVVALWLGESPIAALADGIPTYHLWFLIDLLLFTVAAALLVPVAEPRWRDSQVKWPLLLVAIAFGSYVLDAVTRLLPGAYSNLLGLTSLYRLATYAPYFAVGVWMYSASYARESLLRVPVWLLPLAIALAIGAKGYSAGHGRWVNEFGQMLQIGASWLAVASVLNGFQRFFRARSAATHFFSDASYTVYLFHHLLVITFELLLIPQDWSLWLKFSLICVLTLCLTSVLHIFVVRRIPVLRFLFNGK